MDAETLEIVVKLHELVVGACVHRASSVKIAETAKVIKNSQRDISIAFMDELSVIFYKMRFGTKEVLKVAGVKCDFFRFPRTGWRSLHQCRFLFPYLLG